MASDIDAQVREEPEKREVGGSRKKVDLMYFDHFILFRDMNCKAEVTFLFVLEKCVPFH